MSNGAKVYGGGSIGYNTSSSNNVAEVTGTGSIWEGGATVGYSGASNRFVISDGGKVYGGGSVGINVSSSNNVVVVTGTGSVWSNLSSLSIVAGYNGGSGNRLVVSNGGAVFSSYGALGYSGKSNTIFVTGNDSVWSNTGTFEIGGYGNGSFNSLIVSNGGKVFSGNCLFSYYGGVGSSALITGSGSVWYINLDLSLANYGTLSRVSVLDGGRLYDRNAYVTTSSNTAVVAGDDSLWYSSGTLSIGGDSSLVVSNGGQVFCTNGVLSGVSNPSPLMNSRVLLAGSNSTWIVANSFSLSGRRNSLVISNGGRLFSTVGFLGPDLVSITSVTGNLVTVTGSGSVWSNRDELYIGYSGYKNSMTISNAAQVVNGDCYMGYNTSSSTNSVRVASGAVWQNKILRVGNAGGSNVVLVTGGTVHATNLVIGFASTTCNNLLRLDSGSVVVTNATGDAELEIGQGKLILNGGTLQVNRLVMTNACAQFIRTGGTLIYQSVVLDSTRDADGDGMANGWEQASGLDPLNAADAGADNDGDGFTNLQEFQAGTDPTNASSVFRVLSLESTNNDILVTWLAGGGRTNVVQSAPDLTGSFSNVSPNIILPGSGDVTTNYLEAGGATNAGSRYYRIRLVP